MYIFSSLSNRSLSGNSGLELKSPNLFRSMQLFGGRVRSSPWKNIPAHIVAGWPSLEVIFVLRSSVLDGVSFLHLKSSYDVAEVNCYGIRKLGGEPTQAMTELDSHDRLPEVEFAKRRMRGTKELLLAGQISKRTWSGPCSNLLTSTALQ